MTDKLIDVCAPVLTRAGEPLTEPQLNAKRQVELEDGTAKFADQLKAGDNVRYRPITIGAAINMALDAVDDKLSPDERRKRFALSMRVEEALRAKQHLVTSADDRKRIEAAAELIRDHMVLYRVCEAVDNAEPLKVAKAVKAA